MRNTALKIQATVAIFLAFAAGFSCSLYLFLNLSTVTDKAILATDLKKNPSYSLSRIEQKLKILEPFVYLSVENQLGLDQLSSNINEISNQVDLLSKTELNSSFQEEKKILKKILESEKKTKENLEPFYRTIRSISFQIYRNSFINKKYEVARVFAVVITDLDSSPFYSATKEIQRLIERLENVKEYVEKNEPASDFRFKTIAQIHSLQKECNGYLDLLGKVNDIKESRLKEVQKLNSLFKKREGTFLFETSSFNEFGKMIRFHSFSALVGLGIFFLVLSLIVASLFSKKEEQRTFAELEEKIEKLKKEIFVLTAAVDSFIKGQINVSFKQDSSEMTLKVQESLKKLQNFALEHQEKSELAFSQVSSLKDRIKRETQLKNNIYGQMELLSSGLKKMLGFLKEISKSKKIDPVSLDQLLFQLHTVEHKAQKLTEIGRASLALQGQIEKSFQNTAVLMQPKLDLKLQSQSQNPVEAVSS